MADDFKGQEIVVLDLTAVTPIFDYFVIATGTSKRQMQAMAEEIERALKAEGSSRLGFEGHEGASWILLDYGDVVVHIFTPEARRNYDLERLWADAGRVDWKAAVPPREH